MAALAGRAFGPPPVDKLVRTSAFSSAADTFVAVSLAGSLFFNVSVDAARPRIILYLVLTMAPFAIVAPLIGPFVDRVRGGHRWVIGAACLGRALLCLALAFQLRSLWLYPLAFSILVLNKTHQVAKSALIPRLELRSERLVAANSTHTRVGAMAGAVGGTIAVSVLTLGNATAVLIVGACFYGTALLMALRIAPTPPVKPSPTRRLIEDHELKAPSLFLGVSSMAAIRGAMGFFTFFAAFTLKAAGEPTWVFGAVAVAGGVGGFAATFIAPALRRLLIEERILETAMILPAAAALIVPKNWVAPSLIVVAFALGVAATLGRQGFDSLVQRDAPDAERGRAFAKFEARLQLTWVGGALLPVLVRPSNAVGLFFLGGVLALGAVTYGTSARAAVKRHWGQWAGLLPSVDRRSDDDVVPLDEQLLGTARWLADRGSNRQAVALCAAALDAARRRSPAESTRPELVDALLLAEGVLDRAARSEGEVTEVDVETLIAATAKLVAHDSESGAGDDMVS